MSGDVQPRKRKDKRKKKDEEDLHHAGSTGPEEIIHIQKDHGLGGNVCAKIVFFCLLGALGVMVGLIITEYRGSSEVDTQSALDSPWSLWLDGWIDDSPSHSEADDIGEIDSEHVENSKEEEDEIIDEYSEEEEVDDDDDDDDDNDNDNDDVDDDEDNNDDDDDDDYNDDDDDDYNDDDDENGGVYDDDVDDVDDDNDEDDNSDETNVDLEKSEEDSEEEENVRDKVYNNSEEENVDEESEEEDNKSDTSKLDELEESEENVRDDFHRWTSVFYKKNKEEKSDETNESNEVEESNEEKDSDKINKRIENKSEGSYENVKETENRGKNKSNKNYIQENIEYFNKAKYKFMSKPLFLKKNKDIRKQGAKDEDMDEGVKLKTPYLTEAQDNSKDEDDEEIGSERYRNARKRWKSQGLCRIGSKRHKRTEKKATTSSEEDGNEVAKISEILRRTSNKVKVEEEDEIEKQEDKLEKVEEESLTDEEVEEGEEETSGGKDAPEKLEEPNETEVEGDIIPEIIRRQTLVPPAEELPPPDQESDYSEDDEDIEEEEEDIVQKTYEDLKAKYLQQTPEDSDVEPTEEDFARKAPETYDYSPTPPESEPEEPTESDVDEEEEEEEEDREPLAEWKNRGPALLAEEVEDVQTESESDDEPLPTPSPSLRRGGPLGIDDQVYEKADITNEADWAIKDDLDYADADFNEQKPDVALSKFTALLALHPHSPRALYGKAKVLDHLAEVQRSNQLLASAINIYLQALELPDVPDKLFLSLANRTIDRMRFRGLHLQAVGVHNKLINRYHNVSSHRIELAITYMMVNRLDDAKLILQSSLERWPNDGLTQAYYGLVLKLQGNHEESIPYLEKGLASQAYGTTNSHFYFHLGDMLHRRGEIDRAMKLYEEGTSKGLFRSKYQRSLYNVDHLKAQPWWSIEETTYTQFFRTLEDKWKIIRDEGLAAIKAQKGFVDEAESLRDTGNWKQFEIFARGQKHYTNCNKTPVTCNLIGDFKPASNCRRGQSKFSVMEGGTHVWAHCGPTNCRLRAHLGLVIPNGTSIRVADTTRNWHEGKVLIFDDSFEHEVWHNGTESRLVLIVDVWHPELTSLEKSTLTAI